MKTGAALPEQLKRLEDYGLAAGELRGVAACHYEGGESVCMAGCPIQALFIVVSGRAKVSFPAENGRSLLLGFYDGAGLIGDLEFMTGDGAAHMGVQAVTDMTCLRVPLEENGARLRENGRFLRCAGRALAEKLADSNAACARIILCPLRTRLCAYIAATAEGGAFRERLTETAELLGASYRHLIRALSALCAQGVLEKRGGAYAVLDRDALLRGGEYE